MEHDFKVHGKAESPVNTVFHIVFGCRKFAERAETGWAKGPETKADREKDRDAIRGSFSELTPAVEGKSDSLSPLRYLWIGLPR